MTTPATRAKPWLLRKDNRFAALGLIWLGAYFTARGVLQAQTLEKWVRVAVALAPVPIFGGFLVSFINAIRSLDELERRIHLEAMAVAFPLGILLLQTLALMQRAVELKFEDWSYAHVWIYLPIFYVLSLGVVRKRYS